MMQNFVNYVICNGAVQQVPGGVVCAGGLASVGVLSHRYSIYQSFRKSYFLVWMCVQTIPLDPIFLSRMTICHRRKCALAESLEEFSSYNSPRGVPPGT